MKKYLPILRSSPFFKGLKDNEILSILHCVNATVISKERDSYIFRAGDSTDVMGLVVSGGVLVCKFFHHTQAGISCSILDPTYICLRNSGFS